MASTAFPSIDVTQLFVWLSLVLVVVVAGGLYMWRCDRRGGRRAVRGGPREARDLDDAAAGAAERPVWSPGRRAAMLLLRGYLVVAVLLLVVKTVQLGLTDGGVSRRRDDRSAAAPSRAGRRAAAAAR